MSYFSDKSFSMQGPIPPRFTTASGFWVAEHAGRDTYSYTPTDRDRAFMSRLVGDTVARFDYWESVRQRVISDGS